MFRLACLTWAIALSRVFASSSISDATFDLTNGCELTYGHLIDTLTSIRTVTECSWHCGRTNGCLSVKYNQVNMTCQLNSEQFDSLSSNCTVMLTYATLNQNTVSKLINEHCTETSECSVNNSQCFMNNCQCDPGYSYKSVDESCVTSCDVYGSTFTTYSGYRILGYNSKSYQNVASDDDCKQSCASWTGFVCRSAEYDPVDKKCHLSTKTVLMVPDNYQEHVSFYHFTRNCQ